MVSKKLIRITTIPGSLRGLLKGQLKFMSQNGFNVIGVSSSGTALDDVKNNEGVRTVAIEMTRTISPLRDLQSLLKLIIFLSKEKPQIVHTHTPKAGLLGMIASKIVGVPHRLHTVAGMPLLVATGYKRKLLNIIEKLTYFCATKVYPNSFGLEKIILENKFTSVGKLKVLGKGSSNGIDTSLFDPYSFSSNQKESLRSSIGIKSDDFVFIFVGRLVGDKGVNELVKAFSNIISINAKLLLVGSFENSLDPLGAETLSIINKNPNIIHVGYQQDVIPFFAISNVLVFPSYREGFPNVVMQAAAMQLNSIVTDINGCNEIIKEGENGWIVPVKNVEKLYDRMLWCVENKDHSSNMGKQGRDAMKMNYERTYVWNEILDEYKTLK